MAALTPYIAIAWLAAAIVLFRRLPPTFAVLAIVVVGQLFLPEVHGIESGPDRPQALSLPVVKFTKVNVISYALLLGSLAFDRRRWATVHPQWADVPMALWCIAPFLATVVNGLGPFSGLYEGLTVTISQTLAWGVPYWIGRLYLGSRDGLRTLTGAIVLGGLAYMPLCWIEQAIGPQLHHFVYGFYQHDVAQAIRTGGYRPMVFMEHGLAVAFWMMSAALTAFWLWHEGTFRAIVYHPSQRPLGLGLVVLLLAATTALCRSAGAIILGIVGVIALLLARRLRVAVPLAFLVVLAPAYITARMTETWTGQGFVDVFSENFDKTRASSLEFRLEQESMLLEKVWEKPIFGWGISGKWRIEGKRGQDLTISDSLWIITLATTGLFGLVTLVTATLLPVVRFLWLSPPRLWQGAADAPAAVLAIVLTLHMLDDLVNAMYNPVYMLALGGLAGLSVHSATPDDCD